MPAIAVDTHAIVWYLSGDSRLSVEAGAALDTATAAGDAIHVPSICLVEVVSRSEVPDLPDRIIAATATALSVPLVSGDAKIHTSRFHTIW